MMIICHRNSGKDVQEDANASDTKTSGHSLDHSMYPNNYKLDYNVLSIDSILAILLDDLRLLFYFQSFSASKDKFGRFSCFSPTRRDRG